MSQDPNPVARLAAIVAEESPHPNRVRAAEHACHHETAGDVMKVLFPEGLPYPEIIHEPNFQMVEGLVLKLVRFAALNLRDDKSAHDLASYRYQMGDEN